MDCVVKFRPRERIRRFVKGKSKDLIVFYPGTEYEGVLEWDGTVVSKCGKYNGIFRLKLKEIEITMVLKPVNYKNISATK